MWALLLALAAPATGAVPVSADEAQAMLTELVPGVEAAEGRSFLAAPRLAVATRAQVSERLAREASSASGGASSPWAEDYNRALSESSIALYTHERETIYLVADAFEEMAPALERWEVSPQPLLRCVLVHELIHALQHQYSPWVIDDSADTALASLALLEGHAELAALEYCGDAQPEAVGFFSTLGAHDWMPYGPAPEDRAALIYGYGLAAARLLQAAGGREAIWAALQDPPSFELLRAAVAVTPLEGWSDPGLLRALGEPLLGGGGWTIAAEAGSPQGVARLFGGSSASLPQALAGHTFIARRGPQTVSLLAFLMDSPQAAEALVERRRRALRAGAADPDTPLYFLGDARVARPRQLRAGHLTALSARTEVSATLRLRLGGYREDWVASGAVVFAGFFADAPPGPRGFTALAEALGRAAAHAPPPPSAPPPQVSAWIERVVAASQEGGPRVSWRYRLEQLADRLEDGDASDCVAAASAVFQDTPQARRSELAAAVHGCAVMARDLEGADAMLARLDPKTPVAPLAGYNHALMLRDAGRPADGLALLERIDAPADPEMRQRLGSLRGVLLAEAGRLDEASALARGRGIDPEARAYVASRLAQQGQRLEALRILAGACPLLGGAPRVRCDQLRAQLATP